jgi:hypothetical protein
MTTVEPTDVKTIFKVHTRCDIQLSETIANIVKLAMASRLFYFTCNWAVKHSLLLFYATLTVDRWPRISIYTMHFVAFAFGTTCIFVTIFQCRPINKMWRGAEDSNVHGTCLNINSLYVTHALDII